MPDSGIRRLAVRPARPYINVTNLQQGWGVFAPDPRREVIQVEAWVTYEDGTSSVWRLPRNDTAIGVYRLNRWRKLVEDLIAPGETELWQSFATWIAREHASTRSVPPVQIDLVRRVARLRPPGPGPSRESWTEEIYFTLDVTPLILGRRTA